MQSKLIYANPRILSRLKGGLSFFESFNNRPIQSTVGINTNYTFSSLAYQT